jgi:general secretion pathway protein D
MVFLRPVVVRDAAASDRLSMDRYDLMRSGLKEAQPLPNQVLPINEAAVLPPLTPASKAVPKAAPEAPKAPLAPLANKP